MALEIVELFGYDAADTSPAARHGRRKQHCPFLASTCVKLLRNGEPSGVCTVRQANDKRPIICCPNRLYAREYAVLRDVSKIAFSGKTAVVHPNRLKRSKAKRRVAAFGNRWGRELRIPRKKSGGAYSVDWVLARINNKDALAEFTALEVQSIDTTGNYRTERTTLLQGKKPRKASQGGVNWENVSKRILPQLIYKGQVLRHEARCQRGLFFICPVPVFEKVLERLGGTLPEYAKPHPGTITFVTYDLGQRPVSGRIRRLLLRSVFTTTVDAVANAFVAPTGLPPAGAYETAIRAALAEP